MPSSGNPEEAQMRQSEGWTDRHRVVVEFDDGVYMSKLVHPEGGCRPAQYCSACGRGLDDDETEPCYDCKPPIPTVYQECWVQGWFDNLTAEELLKGSVELVVEPELAYDTCELRIVGVVTDS